MKQFTLGSRIRTLRMKLNMTQAQLANILGVTDKAVSKWERDLSYPDIVLFPKLADVLGITVDDLLRVCDKECRPSKLLQAYEMSRDIRTPLHIILGYVEIIRHTGISGLRFILFSAMWRLSGITTMIRNCCRSIWTGSGFPASI